MLRHAQRRNISQTDMLMFAGAITAGADLTHRGFRLGARYGGGAYMTTTRSYGLRWFHEIVGYARQDRSRSALAAVSESGGPCRRTPKSTLRPQPKG
jgi:hypothetical protein